jgi:CHAT domain-containing protein
MNHVARAFRRWRVAAAIVLGVAVVAVGYRLYIRTDGLVAAAGSLKYRSTEARLSGGFDYRPLAPVTRGGERESERLLALLRALTSIDLHDHHARGRMELLRSNWEDAVALLDEAVKHQTEREQLTDAIAEAVDPKLLNDLAAAHHAVADHGDDALHFVIAAEAAERAWRLSKTPEIAWNRALAIESLHMRDEAIAAWKAYLDLDPDSPWTVEVSARLQKLSAQTLSEAWGRERQNLDRAVVDDNRGEIRRIVRTFPREARMLAEERLAEWGNDQSAAKLVFCRAVGKALERINDDAMLHDTVTHIDRADSAIRDQVVRGLAAYADARTLYKTADRTNAGVRFGVAFETLQRASSPFADVAQMYRWACQRLVDAGAVVKASDAWLASRKADEERYLSLVASVRWTRGLCQMSLGRPQAAIEEYDRARAIFEILGEREGATSMMLTLSEVYDYVGNKEGAWQQRLVTLEHLASSGSKQPLLLETFRTSAASALNEGLPCVAMLLLDHQIAECNTPALYDSGFHALLLRASVRRALGDANGAATDVRRARDVAERVPDPGYRKAAKHAPDVVADRLSGISDPRQKAAILRSAIDFADRRNLAMPLVELYLHQAREFVGLSQWEAAEAALLKGIEHLEKQRETITHTTNRGSFLDARRMIYDKLIELRGRRGDYAGAFDIVERSRARTLLDLVNGGLASVQLPVIQASLPAETALIEFARVGETYGVWIVANNVFEFVPIGLQEDEIARSVDAFRLAVRSNENNAIAESRKLYNVLVRPWYEHARTFERLVFIAEGPLAHVPYAALHDGTQYLIQSHGISVVPSANVLLASLKRDAMTRGTAVALVLAPTYDGAASHTALSAAQAEAVEVAGKYRSAVLLEGLRATREAFMNNVTSAEVIHFAGHSSARKDIVPRLSFAAVGGGAAFVHAEDIRALKLDVARVVVLASCESGMEQLSGDTQGVSSLARAFLAAGAPVVVGSYWEITDDDAAELSPRFHAYFSRGYDAVSALRLAQIEMIKLPGRRMGSWAAFAAIGGTGKTTERR